MIDYEKLGVFYLGREYDAERRQATTTPYLYDSKDLTTHAVVIGMTGSGKTGLCVTLLEEAAIDGIPAIAIDPKGDIGNLMLMFPGLAPESFRPWIDPAEAARHGKSVDDFAKETADQWKKGLADWDQPIDRIDRLRAATDMAIYTPGSNAGHPVSLVNSLAAPPASVLQDGDALRQRISAAVGGLLALLGVTGDPLESREHILMSTIVDRAWRSGQSLEIPSLLRQIQSPPFDKVGFLDLESFFPSADRFALVTRLNNLFASPAFAGWMEGEPLDISKLLYTAGGKPRISIMSIAHLSDAERMFFVTILLNELLSWMRTQPGTSSLRAILYMDEIFGYFPPTANPPSKTPMLTLLKQARAYGIGVVLATQNPVDLDYKGMANTGTWFLGRLQTERDKQRVLDGLEGASTSAGFKFDRASIDKTLSGLAARTFLVNNVHEDGPALLQTRWALSYLRGPLTREQIQQLMKDKVATTSVANSSVPPSEVISSSTSVQQERPMVPPGIEEYFLPANASKQGTKVCYRPAILGIGQAHYASTKAGIDKWEKVYVLNVIISEEMSHHAWEGAKLGRDIEIELGRKPEESFHFVPLVSELSNPKNYSGWGTELKQFLYQHLAIVQYKYKPAKLASEGTESEKDFRLRVRQALSESRDQAIEKIRTKYAPKAARLQERIRKAQQKIDKEKGQANQSIIQAVLSFGSSILAAVLGRKTISVTTVTRASTSARSAGRVMTERADVARAEDDLANLQDELKELDEKLSVEMDEVKSDYPVDNIELESIPLRPKKADLSVAKVVLAWTPWQIDATGIAEPLFTFQGTVPGEVNDGEEGE